MFTKGLKMHRYINWTRTSWEENGKFMLKMLKKMWTNWKENGKSMFKMVINEIKMHRYTNWTRMNERKWEIDVYRNRLPVGIDQSSHSGFPSKMFNVNNVYIRPNFSLQSFNNVYSTIFNNVYRKQVWKLAFPNNVYIIYLCF